MTYAFYPQQGDTEWPLRGTDEFANSFLSFDEQNILRNLFKEQSENEIPDNINSRFSERDFAFQPFGPGEQKFDLKQVEFFPLHRKLANLALHELSETSFLLGTGTGNTGAQLLDKHRQQIWYKHNRILITVDRAVGPPGHLILLLARESPVELWQILQSLRSVLFASELEMDMNLAIDFFENQIPLEYMELIHTTEVNVPFWPYLDKKNLAWLGSIVADSWNIESPTMSDLSGELQTRLKIPADGETIARSMRNFGSLRITQAVREVIPFSSLIRTGDADVSGMPIYNQIIISTANRNNKIQERKEMSRLRQKLMWAHDSIPHNMMWDDFFMIEKWPQLNSILYQTIYRTGETILFSPTLSANLRLMHIFRQSCVDEMIYSLTHYVTKDGTSVNHQGDFLQFFQNKVERYFEEKLSGLKIVKAWMTFLKGFISVEGWFVSFYKPTLLAVGPVIETSYIRNNDFKDFSQIYREKCLRNEDPNDLFYHQIKFTTNGEAYTEFVRDNPVSAVQSKDRMHSILPVFGRWLRQDLLSEAAGFFTKVQSIQQILKWRNVLRTSSPPVDTQIWHIEGIHALQGKNWTLLKPMSPPKVLGLLQDLPSFHQQISWENWTTDLSLPVELFHIPLEAIQCALRHLMETLWNRVNNGFPRAMLTQGPKTANEKVFDLQRLRSESVFREWGEQMKNWPSSEPQATLSAIKRVLPSANDQEAFNDLLRNNDAKFDDWFKNLDKVTGAVPKYRQPIDLTIQNKADWYLREKIHERRLQGNEQADVFWNIIRRNLSQNLRSTPQNQNICRVSTLMDLDPVEEETSPLSSPASPTGSSDPAPETWIPTQEFSPQSILHQTDFLVNQDKSTDIVTANFISKHVATILSPQGRDRLDPMLLNILQKSMGAVWLKTLLCSDSRWILDKTVSEGLRLKADFDLHFTRDISAQELGMPGAPRLLPVFYAGSPSAQLGIAKDTYQMTLSAVPNKYILLEVQVDQSGLKDWQSRDVRMVPILLNGWTETDFHLMEHEKSRLNESPSGKFYCPSVFDGKTFNWDRYIAHSTLTKQLYQQPALFKKNFENITEMLRNRDILPVLMFKSDKDFFACKALLDWTDLAQPITSAPPIMGFIHPRLEEKQFNMLGERLDTNANLRVTKGQINQYLSISRSRAKNALDAAGSRFLTMFTRRNGQFHYAMSPSFLTTEMLLLGPGFDTLCRRGDFAFEESAEQTLQTALFRDEIVPVTVKDMTDEHRLLIENPLKLRSISQIYHANMMVAQRVLECTGRDWDPSELNKMNHFKKLILRGTEARRPQELTNTPLTHEKWKNFQCMQPRPVIIGEFTPNIWLRPRRANKNDLWFNNSFSHTCAIPFTSDELGNYATFNPNSLSPLGHAMTSLFSMWTESATMNRVRTAIRPSILRLAGLEPPILEIPIVSNQVQHRDKIVTNHSAVLAAIIPASTATPNNFLSDNDLYETFAARAKLEQSDNTRSWFQETLSFLSLHNLCEPLLGENDKHDTQWSYLSAEAFAADGRQWSRPLATLKWTSKNSESLAWAAHAIKRWESKQDEKFILHNLIFSPDMAYRRPLEISFVPSNLIAWPWGLRMMNERHLWPTRRGRNMALNLKMPAASLPLEWVCDQILIFSPAPHRKSAMNREVAKALAVTTITNPLKNWFEDSYVDGEPHASQAYQARIAAIDRALEKPDSYQRFQQSIWSISAPKLVVIRRWIELLSMVELAEAAVIDPTLEEFCDSDAFQAIAIDIDAMNEIAHKIHDLQPEDFRGHDI